MNDIFILSGPPGAGKSVAADLLCARFAKAVHLQVDHVQAWICSGFIPPYNPESFPQTLTIARASARAAAAFAADSYRVFLEGVIGPDVLTACVDEIKASSTPARVHFVHLLPTAEALVQRSHDREQVNPGVTDEMLRQVHDMFAGWEMPGIIFDNTDVNPEQTADALIEAFERRDTVVWEP